MSTTDSAPATQATQPVAEINDQLFAVDQLLTAYQEQLEVARNSAAQVHLSPDELREGISTYLDRRDNRRSVVNGIMTDPNVVNGLVSRIIYDGTLRQEIGWMISTSILSLVESAVQEREEQLRQALTSPTLSYQFSFIDDLKLEVQREIARRAWPRDENCFDVDQYRAILRRQRAYAQASALSETAMTTASYSVRLRLGTRPVMVSLSMTQAARAMLMRLANSSTAMAAVARNVALSFAGQREQHSGVVLPAPDRNGCVRASLFDPRCPLLLRTENASTTYWTAINPELVRGRGEFITPVLMNAINTSGHHICFARATATQVSASDPAPHYLVWLQSPDKLWDPGLVFNSVYYPRAPIGLCPEWRTHLDAINAMDDYTLDHDPTWQQETPIATAG